MPRTATIWIKFESTVFAKENYISAWNFSSRFFSLLCREQQKMCIVGFWHHMKTSSCCKISDDDIKTKMRNLRTQYGKEMGKMKSLKVSGSGTGKYLPTNLEVVPIIEFCEGQSCKDKPNTRSPSRTSNVGRQWECWAILCWWRGGWIGKQKIAIPGTKAIQKAPTGHRNWSPYQVTWAVGECNQQEAPTRWWQRGDIWKERCKITQSNYRQTEQTACKN